MVENNNKKLSHSFSSTELFRTCPRQFHEVRILDHHRNAKQHPAAAKGAKLHKVWEEAYAENTDVGPSHQWVLDYVRHKFTGLKAPEQKFAVNDKFEPCDWFDERVFYRAILDVLCINDTHVDIQDYKTGKYRPKPRQGQEQALMSFFHFKDLKTATMRFIWTHADQAPTTATYDRALDGERMIDELLDTPNEIRLCLDSDHWPETPNPLCSYCPVRSCRYNTNETLEG